MQPTPQGKGPRPGLPNNKPKTNPILTAVKAWAATLPPSHSNLADTLALTAPKRWVVYEPMVLLPAGSLTNPIWESILNHAQIDPSPLWTRILESISRTTKSTLTHLAVNEGIPLQREEKDDYNILRSPTGLRILHGDFGPVVSSPTPTQQDFREAFWVTTRQNGIVQTWAPRYTMFSRGNVTEKARLLDFHSSQSLVSHRVEGSRLRNGWAVDLYGGIGYFVFSYARLGLRVLAWEINPWSVEGLRRGAGMNGWDVRVVGDQELVGSPGEAIFGMNRKGEEGEENRIVVFLQDNRHAEGIVRELRLDGRDVDVVHVNCGLLPSGTDTWRPALNILGEGEGWLHLHENVGVGDIESRREEIGGIFNGWLEVEGGGRTAEVEHVEKVKTFAPGVWHCVFDVYVSGGRGPT